MLEINALQASAGDTSILQGVTLSVAPGETVALLGPNGSGKSTLAHVLMGHPGYRVTGGAVRFFEHDLLSLAPEARAHAGLFLAFQYPQAIAGVNLGHFLRLAYNSVHTTSLGALDFLKLLREKLALLELAEDFIQRSVNESFSGGEKKRVEMLQLAILEPRLAILDETDSGLDVDALKIVGRAVQTLQAHAPRTSWLVITHYQRLLDHIVPQRVAIMQQGRITQTGGAELVARIETHGYAKGA
jgi:Fe-S cluster assembly ATP-binding protein